MEIQRSYEPKRKMNIWLLCLFVICVSSFSIISVMVAGDKYPIFDQRMYNLFAGQTGPTGIAVLEVLSLLASKPAIIGISILTIILLWLIKKDYAGMLTMFLFVMGGNFVNKIVKEWIQRERPLLEGAVVEGYSFPSGHAMVGLIMYGLIVYFIHRHSSRFFLKNVVLYGAIFLMLVIGVSRFVLREHYATDVLAGYSLGGAILMAAIAVYSRICRSQN
ncbi:MAG TPA: phosphatase PAP2 family protein [Bacillus sp. (in: firmicutes)]|nr:phosphatase PAP2 family protein [Bacillus sp. (in: firmicutes)]